MLNRVRGLNYRGYKALHVDEIRYVVDHDGIKYMFSSFQPDIVMQVKNEYCYDDLRKDDIVLDIGANIGAFSLGVCDRVKHVYALEPVFDRELAENIRLNDAGSKITVIHGALSFNSLETISFNGVTSTSKGYSLIRLKYDCGGRIDFLKCDCEGAEHIVNEYDWKTAGIRRVEMELHYSKPEERSHYIDMLENVGYRVEVKNRTNTTCLIHAVAGGKSGVLS